MATDLERVKEILLGAEYEDLLALRQRFATRDELTQEVAGVIAEALEARAKTDDRVADVLAPTIDQAITGSIDQDPKKLAESLYPIMGPAIRKSITETLQQMLDNFNQLLEQSLSPQSLRWRFDAWRTGRSYSEMVLLNTLEYDVEQVFLIHQETSLLIRHAYSETADQKDPDMVSGMFSAIQDFIQDSFSTNEEDVLDTLRLGELNVVIQRGPTAILAIVVRGSVPEQLRLSLRTTSEAIYQKKKVELRDYAGDPEPFADLEPDLQEILAHRHSQPDKKREIPWLALVSIGAMLIVGGYYYTLETQRKEALQTKINLFDQQAGVVVLKSALVEDSAAVFALVDPLVVDPLVLLDIPGAQLNIAPYFSAEDEIVAQRASKRLQPPATVSVSVVKGTLELAGTATEQWLRANRSSALTVTGIHSLDLANLTIVNPVMQALNENQQMVTSFTYVFEKEASDIAPGDPAINDLAQRLVTVDKLRGDENMNSATFDVVGYTDNSGSTELNRRIGLERAQNLIEALREQGVTSNKINAYNGLDYTNSPVIDGREVRIFIKD